MKPFDSFGLKMLYPSRQCRILVAFAGTMRAVFRWSLLKKGSHPVV
jgi:hypothetical protein